MNRHEYGVGEHKFIVHLCYELTDESEDKGYGVRLR